MVTGLIGNLTLGLVILLLLCKAALWTSMLWSVVLAPFWIPFMAWGVLFGLIMAWVLFMLFAQITRGVLSAIFK